MNNYSYKPLFVSIAAVFVAFVGFAMQFTRFDTVGKFIALVAVIVGLISIAVHIVNSFQLKR